MSRFFVLFLCGSALHMVCGAYMFVYSQEYAVSSEDGSNKNINMRNIDASQLTETALEKTTHLHEENMAPKNHSIHAVEQKIDDIHHIWNAITNKPEDASYGLFATFRDSFDFTVTSQIFAYGGKKFDIPLQWEEVLSKETRTKAHYKAWQRILYGNLAEDKRKKYSFVHTLLLEALAELTNLTKEEVAGVDFDSTLTTKDVIDLGKTRVRNRIPRRKCAIWIHMYRTSHGAQEIMQDFANFYKITVFHTYEVGNLESTHPLKREVQHVNNVTKYRLKTFEMIAPQK